MRLLAPVLGLCLLLPACRTTYEGRYRYSPTPHEVAIQPEGAEHPVARLLISLRGLRDADPDAGRPLSMGVRLRLENLLEEGDVWIDDLGLQLLDAGLTAFGKAASPAAIGEAVPAGATRTLDLAFPLPGGRKPGQLDLSGLHLAVPVRYPDGTARVSTTFERLEPQVVYVDGWYYDPFYPRYYSRFYVHYHHH